MVTTAFLLALFTSLLLLSVAYWSLQIWSGRKHGKNPKLQLPPGPPSYPIIGCLPSLLRFKSLAEGAQSLRHTYGGIVRLNMGLHRIVLLTEYDIMKAVLKHKNVLGRPHVPFTRTKYGLGIFANAGKPFIEQRRFAVQTLNRYNMDDISMESHIFNAAQQLTEYLGKRQNTPLDPTEPLNLANKIVMMKILANVDMKMEDPRVTRLPYLKLATAATDLSFSSLAMIFPQLANWFPVWSGFSKFEQQLQSGIEELRKVIKNHKETRTRTEPPRDFIDAYLSKIEETEEPKSSFFESYGEKNLEIILSDLFSAATDSSKWAVTWALFYMAQYPHVKQRVQNELTDVMGQTRSINIEELENLPYTKATLEEVFRKSSISPLGLPRWVTENTEVEGYFLEKDTLVFPWYYGIHHDKTLWGEDAEEFKPERFLVQSKEDGRIQFQNSIYLTAFGRWSRACPGESVGRKTVFILFTAIMHSYDFDLDTALECPSKKRIEALIRIPPPFKLVFSPREL